MLSFIKRHPVWSFLILNYLISWSFLYPCYRLIENNDSIPPLAFIGMIGAYGPSIAAIIIQYIIDKKRLKALLRSLIKFKVGYKIYLFVILVPLLLYALAYLISALNFDGNLRLNMTAGLSGIAFWVLVALPFGPMGEELGWRGFMLPKLLEDHSVIKSTLLVGIAWGIWHLASFSFPGAALPIFFEVSAWTIGLFILNTIALSMVYTYVHLKTKGSVFLAIVLHAFFNAAANIVFDFFGETDDLSLQICAYVINLILAGTLGYLLIRKHEKLNAGISSYINGN